MNLWNITISKSQLQSQLHSRNLFQNFETCSSNLRFLETPPTSFRNRYVSSDDTNTLFQLPKICFSSIFAREELRVMRLLYQTCHEINNKFLVFLATRHVYFQDKFVFSILVIARSFLFSFSQNIYRQSVQRTVR